MIAITCCLEKGGSAKTTTTHAIGAGLARLGNRVLFVDLDPQGNLTQTMLGEEVDITSADVIAEEIGITEAIKKVSDEIDILPANRTNAKLERKIGDEIGREHKLKEALDELEDYDYVVIDTPPALGLLTINALSASDWVVIPAQTDVFALDGIESLGKTIQTVQQYSNPTLKIAGVLLTRYNKRTNLSKLAGARAEELAEEIGTKVFDAKIREGIAVREAQAVGEDLFSYAPRSNPAKDYQQFIEELTTTIKEGK